jgi:hypothetical protein
MNYVDLGGKLTCGRRQRHKPNGNKMIEKWLNTNVIYAMNGQEGLML